MIYEITMADVCELAHALTAIECERLNIKVDEFPSEDHNDAEYTPEAQDIFNEYYDLITEKLGV